MPPFHQPVRLFLPLKTKPTVPVCFLGVWTGHLLLEYSLLFACLLADSGLLRGILPVSGGYVDNTGIWSQLIRYFVQ